MAGTTTVLFSCDLGKNKFWLISTLEKKMEGEEKGKKGERKLAFGFFYGWEKMSVGILVDVFGGIMVSLVSLGVGLSCASDVCFHFSGCTV